jgi:hypothetical protein
MSYKKIMVDNPTCSRRFHITFDDEANPVARTEIRCSYCNVVVFSEDNHPQVNLAREENLTKTTALSNRLAKQCDFEDPFRNVKTGQPTKPIESTEVKLT